MYEKIKKISITCNCSFKVTFIFLFINSINKDYIILCNIFCELLFQRFLENICKTKFCRKYQMFLLFSVLTILVVTLYQFVAKY